MSDNRPISPESSSSLGDSTRREFLSSGRVVTSPSPTPVSETRRDFQLICGNSRLLSPTLVGPFLTEDCRCGPECPEPCCVQRGWTIKSRNSISSYDSSKNHDASEGRLHGSSNAEHDNVSIESSDSHLGDSGGDRPLLSPTEQRRFGNNTVINRGENGPTFVVVSNGLDRDSVRCGCHVKVVDKTARRAKIKLILASIIALVFMVGEVLGGYFANSLAIMTDAAHMLSDFAGFLISLFAIWLASRPSSSRMSFGWHRAEVMGAVVSVLIIWVITGVLFYEAIQRVIHPTKIDADIMLITACVGVFVNVFMCMVLHPHSHDHGHGHGHGKKKRSGGEVAGKEAEKEEENGRGQKWRIWQRRKKHKHGSQENINVHAAFIHVVGDLIQSVGVVIAGYIIRFKPEWTIADPICTFIFCILVLISTLNVLKDALRVLMEGTPKHIDYEELKEELEGVEGVRKAHSLHIWSLTLNRTALAAHLVINSDSPVNHQEVLNKASKMLKEKYNITTTTLQVEDHHDLMEECDTCQESDKSKFCAVCWPL